MAFKNHALKAKEQWNYLFNDLDVDVAMLTEMGDPAETGCPFPYVKWRQIGNSEGYCYWGTGIVSRNPLSAADVPPSVGALMTANLRLENRNDLITLIAVYGLKDYGIQSYVPVLHKYLSELDPILRGDNYRNIVIGGDFNADAAYCFDGKNGNTKNAERLFFERLRDYNLDDVLKPFATYPVQTHRHNSDTTVPFQIDHLYASHGLAKAAKSVEVLTSPLIDDLSDHNPIVAEFEI